MSEMEQYTIKEVADITGISSTTIRRYIKSGKITASLQKGRYGPEYKISRESISAAGLEKSSLVPVKKNGNNNGRSAEDLSALLKDFVPTALFQELSMKHEQLLVQYGMIRAGGQRLLEYKADSDVKEQMLKEKQMQFEMTLKKFLDEINFLKKHLRLAELEIEGKNTKIRELKDKMKVLELVSRNAVTTESIEKQFLEIYSKQQEIQRLSGIAKKVEQKAKKRMVQEKTETDH